MTFITVAIPTYNGEQRLPQVLECLIKQTNLEEITWEVLVVDNNSTDATAKLTRQYQQNWPTENSLKYHFAAKQGAAFARQKAIEAAQGDIVAFLDDDNLPAEDWVEQVYQFAIAHPRAGAFGSRIYGCFEVEPTQQITQKIAPFLAIVNRGEDPHQYYASQRVLPPGAGLAVRKQAWFESVPDHLFLNYLGQRSDTATASEDLEVLIHIQKFGWEIWHNPAMIVYHQIPKERLQEQNVLLLLRRIGLSRFHIRMLRYSVWQRPFLGIVHVLLDFTKLLIYYLKLPLNARRSRFERICEREYLLSSLLSPFFLVRKYQSERRSNQIRQKDTPNYEFWLNRISNAFENQLFCLFSQTIKALDKSQPAPAIVEVLLRLQTDDSSRSTFSATDFMPTAVSFSLTKVIDRWVVEEVARLLFTPDSDWASDRRESAIVYFINLSAASVNDEYFSRFLSKLTRYQPDLVNQLCFELDEPSLLGDLDQSVRFIQEIRALGFAVAIDNISNFSKLRTLLKSVSVEYLKINSYGLETTYRDLLLLQSEQKMPLKIIAVRVENKALLEKAEDLCVDYAQGYAIEVPQPLRVLNLVA